jgi:ABC-type Fe3+ transport system substrate-binding protein
MDELVRQALRDGRLTVAGGGPAALYTPWAAGFEKQYPGITVQVRGAFSSQLVADIDRQLESGAPAVDVAILQTLQDFGRWKAAGALLKTDNPAMEQLAPDWRDDDGRYLPIGVFALGYGYDPRQVAARQVPSSAARFTDPRWRGRVISTYPHQDDVTLYLYSVLAERHGWSFIDQLLASSPQFVNGHLGVAQGLAAGTAALSFDHIISLGAADRRAGRLAFTVPADDPMPVWPQNAAIFDGSPSPAAAKLFLRWLLEPEQQNAIAQGGAWSPRLDIAPPPGLAPLAELNVANGFRAFITRTADAQDYRDRFAALIGPVTGPEYR